MRQTFNQISCNSIKEGFVKYLVRTVGIKENSAKVYTNSLRVVSDYLKSHHLVDSDIYEIKTIGRLKHAMNFVSDSEIMSKQDMKCHYVLSTGLDHYYKYLRGVSKIL